MPVHHAWRILIVVITVLLFITSVVLSALSAIPDTNGPFTEGESQLLGVETFRTKILPSTWAFASTWSGIYIYVFLGLIYCLTTLCRRSAPGTFLYYNPLYLPTWMYVSLSIANILSVVWLYLADRQMLWEALLTYVVELLFLGVALLVALFSLSRNKAELKRIGKKAEIGWTIGLVHNSIGMFVTWVYFLTTGNLCSVMVYEFDVSMDISCMVCLSLAAVELLGVFIADNFIWYEDRKYMYTPYVVALVYFIGIITNNYEAGELITIFVFVLLSFAILTLIFKIAWSVAKESRKKKQPGRNGKNLGNFQNTAMPAATPIAFPTVMPAGTCNTSNLTGAMTYVHPNQIGVHVQQPAQSFSIAPQHIELSHSYPSEIKEQTVIFREETKTPQAMSSVSIPVAVTSNTNPAPVYVCQLDQPSRQEQPQHPLYPDLHQLLATTNPQPTHQETITLGPGGSYRFS